MSRVLLCSKKLCTRGRKPNTSSISRLFISNNEDSTFTNLHVFHTPCSTFSTTFPEYPMTPNKSFTVSYLIDSCGLSEDQAVSVSKKMQLKTSAQPDSVLALFRNQEFLDTQISEIIQKFPSLLLSKPDKTLSPKLKYFNSMGFYGPELAHILCTQPTILRHSLERRIKPLVTFFKGLGLTQSDISKMITCSSRVFCENPQKRLAPSIALLRNHGVPDCYISKLLVMKVRAFIFTDQFTKTVEEVMKLKFEPSKASFVQAILVLSSLSRSSWEAKCNIFKRWGWSEDDIHMAFRINPFCMKLSEKKITGVMDFFVKKMGYDPLLLAKDPFILTYSIENRIIPRLSVIHVLVANGYLNKDINLGRVLRPTDDDFLKKFVTKFEDRVPSLLNVYQGKK